MFFFLLCRRKTTRIALDIRTPPTQDPVIIQSRLSCRLLSLSFEGETLGFGRNEGGTLVGVELGVTEVETVGVTEEVAVAVGEGVIVEVGDVEAPVEGLGELLGRTIIDTASETAEH